MSIKPVKVKVDTQEEQAGSSASKQVASSDMTKGAKGKLRAAQEKLVAAVDPVSIVIGAIVGVEAREIYEKVEEKVEEAGEWYGKNEEKVSDTPSIAENRGPEI